MCARIYACLFLSSSDMYLYSLYVYILCVFSGFVRSSEKEQQNEIIYSKYNNNFNKINTKPIIYTTTTTTNNNYIIIIIFLLLLLVRQCFFAITVVVFVVQLMMMMMMVCAQKAQASSCICVHIRPNATWFIFSKTKRRKE